MVFIPPQIFSNPTVFSKCLHETSVEALTLTWCQGKHGQGLSSGSHSGDQRPPTVKVMGKDGHSGQEGQTVAKTCIAEKILKL